MQKQTQKEWWHLYRRERNSIRRARWWQRSSL